MIKITIKNKIIVEDASVIVKRWIKKRLTLPNPLWFKMLKMGKTQAMYGVPKYFKYYLEENNQLMIGRGFHDKLLEILMENNYGYEIRSETSKQKITEELKGQVKFRTYQHGDIESIAKHTNGVITCGTGYGKSVIGTALIKHLGTRTLIIVPRTHLLKQFAEEIKKHYSYDVGVIQGKKEDIKDITIASIQTLIKRPELVTSLSNYYGMVIVDECHTAITKKRLNVIQSFNPHYLYGMTATPRRTDQQGKAIFFTFGPMILNKKLPQTPPEIELVNSNAEIPVLAEYAEMINEQVNNAQRNVLICSIVEREVKNKRKILVLTKRIKHYEKISKLLPEGYRQFSIASKDQSKKRSELLQELRENKREFDVILGTYSMLSTGTDIPALDTLIFAGDLRSDVLQEQSSGRILRLFGDKQHPKIIDIIDNKNGILNHQAISRIRFYKRQGWL